MHKPYFYKLFLSNTIKERRLRIPDNFVKVYGNDLSAFGRLSVPGGPVWPVGLIKADDKFWFHEGWREFTERYSIRIGYFLVFRYEGHSVFIVHIFNLSTSEINYQPNNVAARKFLLFEDMEDEEFIEHLSSSAACFASDSLKRTAQLSKVAKISAVEQEVGVPFNSIQQKHLRLYAPDGKDQKPEKRGRKKQKVDPTAAEHHPSTQRTDDFDLRFRFYANASARKRTVTAEEREMVINTAKAFEPINPFCRVVLRPSYLYRGCIMYLPSSFAEKHLNGVSGSIKLQSSDGRQWSVRCLYRGGRAKLSQGWYEFTVENNMGEGDVCIFELLKSRDIVLKVTVFRVLEVAGRMSP